MKVTTILVRSLLLVCLFGTLAACSSGEQEPKQEPKSEVGNHGHSHD